MPTDPATPAVAPPAPRPTLRALIVEDSATDAFALITLLRTGGWQVNHRRVASGPDLLAALAAEPWDLILSDHTMPGFSAPEALRLVQQTGIDIPFIIISGGIEEGVAIETMKAGAHDFIMKGALGRLVPAVQRELREAAVRQARRQAEATLRESELRYRSVWENSTDAVLLIDLGGVIRFASPAVGTVFGWSPEALAGQTLDALQPEEIAPGTWWRLARATSQGALETAGRRRDGSAVEVDVAFNEMRMGEELWVVAFFRDVTERRRAEAELQRNREEFAAAREIQQRLFPRVSPEVPGVELAGVSHPADAAGGDYFDWLPMPDGSLGLVIADVSGHGVGPSLLMAEARAYLRPLARRTTDVAEILTRAQELLADDLGSQRYITLLLVRLDPVKRTLTYASAGHPSGFLLRADGSLKAELKRTGRPLGRQGGSPYATGTEIALEAGDTLLLVTDGIDEAMRADGECFGLARATEFLRAHRHLPAGEIVERLCQAARDFTQPEPQADDLTVVVLKAR
jgi:sigma-B regulation protein RsbU (phosphoserine phosphatase)